jgi:signal peptidase I
MPARGEIVVFPSPIDGVDLVKRVVAVAGDTVEVRGGRLVLNGRELALEPAGRDADGAELFIEALGDVRHVVRRLPGSRRHGDLRPFVVPEGAFFAMGDNRDNSADSRVFGAVPVTSLRGRARRLLFSIDAERSPYVRLGRTGGALR